MPGLSEKHGAGASVIAFRRAKRDKCAKTLEGMRKMKRRRGASPKVSEEAPWPYRVQMPVSLVGYLLEHADEHVPAREFSQGIHGQYVVALLLSYAA